MLRSLILVRRARPAVRRMVAYVRSSSTASSVKSADKPAGDDDKQSKRQLIGRWFPYTVAAAAIAGLSIFGMSESENRKSIRSRDLQIHLLRGLLQKYVPKPLTLAGIDDLIGSAEIDKALKKFESDGQTVMLLNGPPNVGMTEAVRKYFAGREGIIDLTDVGYVCTSDLHRALERLAPELQLYSADEKEILLAAEQVVCRRISSDNRPTVLLDLDRNGKTAIDLTKKLIRSGYRIVLVTHTNVRNEFDMATADYDYVINDAANRADKAVKAERYLLSSSSGIQDCFVDHPAEAKRIAEVFGTDIDALTRFVYRMRFDRWSMSIQKDPGVWLDAEIYAAHLKWMQAIASIPNIDEYRIRRLVDNMLFNAHGRIVSDAGRDVFDRLAAFGIVWRPVADGCEFNAAPVFIAAWQTHTAKALLA